MIRKAGLQASFDYYADEYAIIWVNTMMTVSQGRNAVAGRLCVAVGALIALPLMLSSAQAVATTISTSGGGSAGTERCLVGVGTLGSDTCTGTASSGFAGQDSIVNLLINDIGGDWQRIVDPADSIFTYLANSSGDTTSVRGRARFASNADTFGATVNGTYTQLFGVLPSNRVLLSGDPSLGAFVSLDTLGLLSGDFWEPTIETPDGNFYSSNPADNPGGLDRMVTFRTVDPINDPSDGFNAFRYIIAFEDHVNNLGDGDYNDYVVELEFSALRTATLPEPASLALVALGFAGMGALRYRRKTIA
jgi:hypothetical protein